MAGRGAERTAAKAARIAALRRAVPRPEAQSPGTEKPQVEHRKATRPPSKARARPASSKGLREVGRASRCSTTLAFLARVSAEALRAQADLKARRSSSARQRITVSAWLFENRIGNVRASEQKLGVMAGLDPGIHDELQRAQALRKSANAAPPHGLPGQVFSPGTWLTPVRRHH